MNCDLFNLWMGWDGVEFILAFSLFRGFCYVLAWYFVLLSYDLIMILSESDYLILFLL